MFGQSAPDNEKKIAPAGQELWPAMRSLLPGGIQLRQRRRYSTRGWHELKTIRAGSEKDGLVGTHRAPAHIENIVNEFLSRPPPSRNFFHPPLGENAYLKSKLPWKKRWNIFRFPGAAAL